MTPVTSLHVQYRLVWVRGKVIDLKFIQADLTFATILFNTYSQITKTVLYGMYFAYHSTPG